MPGMATEGKDWSGKRSRALRVSLMTRIRTATANAIIFGSGGAQWLQCMRQKAQGLTVRNVTLLIR